MVWEVATGKQLQRIETGYATRGSAEYVFLTPDWQRLFVSWGKRKVERVEQDGKRLLRWEFDGGVRAWDLATGRLERTYQHRPPRNVLGMELAPDGTRFVTFEELPGTYEGSPRRAASLWDVATGRYRPLPDGLQSYGIFSPDRRSLAISAVDKNGYTKALKLFDAATGREKLSIPIKDKNAWADAAAFSPDSRLVVGQYRVFERPEKWDNWQSWLKWWDATTGREVASFAGDKNDAFLWPTFSPDGQTLSATNWRGRKAKLFLFRTAEKRLTKTLIWEAKKGERVSASRSAFSPDGNWLVLSTQVMPDKQGGNWDIAALPQPRIHLIDVATGSIRETLIAPPGGGQSPCFSPDGRTLATGGQGRVLLWDLTRPPLGAAARRE